MKNYKFLIQYDGSRYNGWQRQKNVMGTIQGKIENVLMEMTGKELTLQGAGRTDAGVHARGQVASVHLESDKSVVEIQDYLNQYLPADIRIYDVKEASPRFHARLLATGKHYRYTIDCGKTADVFARKYVMRAEGKLDMEKMRAAAKLLEGRHDFKSFCGNKKMKKSTVRTIEEIRLVKEGQFLHIDYYGDGFLQHMVRIMTGTLLEVGRGERAPEDIADILNKKDRKVAGFMAPAKGLCLMQVYY